MNREELNDRFEVTEEQINAWAEACERGDYPGVPVGEVMVGRPRKFGEDMQPITFKETESKIILINARAADLDISRSDYLRMLIDQDLAQASA